MSDKLGIRVATGVRGAIGESGERALTAGRLALGRGAAATERQRQRRGERTDTRAEFGAKASSVLSAHGNRKASVASLNSALELMQTGAPKASAAAIATALRATDYLASKLPRDPVRAGAFAADPIVSRAEAERWLRRARAVEDPTTVLADLQAGKLSREAVEAVREVYPRLYEDMRQQALEQVAELDAKGERPPYQRRLQLGLLLDIPTDPSLEPSMLAALQGVYSEDAKAAAAASSRSRGTAPNIAAGFRSGSASTEGEL